MNAPEPEPSTEDTAPEATYLAPNRADARAFRRLVRAKRRRNARERDQATARKR